MESYKAAIYEQYIKFHNAHLLGEISLQRFVSKFPVNEFYWSKFLPENKNTSILEIGCGDGGLVYWLHHKGYHQVVGVDLSAEQIAVGRQLGVQNLHEADLIEFLHQSEKGFDLIIARDVFEHFTRQDFYETLCLIKQKLNKDGALVIQSPNGQGLHFTHYYYSDITHEIPFTVSSLRQLGLAAGFGAVEAFPLLPYNRGVWGRIRSVLWKLKTWQLQFWKMVETGNPSGIFTANLMARFKV